MDDKDVIIAAALLSNSANTFKQSMDSAVDTERTKAQTATKELNRLRLENERAARANAEEKARIDEWSSQQTDDELRKVKAQNLNLTTRLNYAEREIAEMRIAMREWVASQRGLLALAKALREESETCPHQEHHKIGGIDVEAKTARFKIAEAAADISLADANDDIAVVKTKIPAYVPRSPERMNK
jgi:chromosome segregation ATPase